MSISALLSLTVVDLLSFVNFLSKSREVKHVSHYQGLRQELKIHSLLEEFSGSHSQNGQEEDKILIRSCLELS